MEIHAASLDYVLPHYRQIMRDSFHDGLPVVELTAANVQQTTRCGRVCPVGLVGAEIPKCDCTELHEVVWAVEFQLGPSPMRANCITLRNGGSYSALEALPDWRWDIRAGQLWCVTDLDYGLEIPVSLDDIRRYIEFPTPHLIVEAARLAAYARNAEKYQRFLAGTDRSGRRCIQLRRQNGEVRST